MSPGDAPTSPRSLGDRITIALDQLRAARAAGDLDKELAWETRLDLLLDRLPRALP